MDKEARETPDRYALYYPRIHFRDLDWLKATLLAFGRVYRIAPQDHALGSDPPELRTISQRHGAENPLVFEIDPEWSAIEFAQGRLLDELHATDPSDLDIRFGLAATQAREAVVGAYEIHRSKVNNALFDTLCTRSLAWESENRSSGEPWIRVHPDLGGAIMAVSAVASARGTGSDVVTDSATLHTAVAALDEVGVLRHLLHPHALADAELSVDRTSTQLAHVIMTTRWELGDLSLADVSKLIADGNDLRRFRRHLATYASTVPPELDQTTREERLQELAGVVSKDWAEMQKGPLKRLLRGLGEGSAKAAEDIAKDALKGMVGMGVLAGAAALTAPAVLGTLAVAAVPITFAVVGAGLASRRDKTVGPMTYLSRIKRAGGFHVAVPCSYRPPETPVASDAS